MQGNRQDAWSSDEDVLLAETVLRFIREGNTQLEAFKEVGKQLSRTAAACGFRWNATLRKQYEEAIHLAKQNRKKITFTTQKNVSMSSQEQPNIHEVIQTLEQLQKFYQDNSQQEELQSMIAENQQLKESITKYKSFTDSVYHAMEKLKQS
ncbi:RsfA family transcriptional regulator [Gracilibacillus caseinilyticus]|uniref:RsfA family transcriptional regulator n=1 Tax=Gracilibacillus caseinilyticus TaxID=2932256 RepID=A0ABY4EUI3_9BACI|nr:RsfA family transcriptional regulator [Gracilibacillus caseinilyticus]UOQ47970.1 RsfA family transcriptional regulator [Gracilibacillus caseinilyticus]